MEVLAAAQSIKACRYSSRDSVNVYIKYQNKGKSVISMTLTMARMLLPDGILSISETAALLGMSLTTVTSVVQAGVVPG